jgi:ParB/RepB/Spo0J family partition protein
MITTQQKTKSAPKVRQKKARPGQNLRCTHDIPVEVCGFGCQRMPEYREYLSQFQLSIMFGPKEVDESSTAIKVYVEQSELDEMERINACQKIDEGKPIEFYDYEGEPVVITGTSSSGREGMISAEGWRIVPEKDAEGVTKPEQDEFETMSYIGTRVNVGGKSRPNWWVIVGPVYEFERKPKESGEGFQPGFPPGFDPKRAETGLAQEDKADEGTPFPTEFSQEEINRMAEMCAAQAISEAKRAIKIYRVEGQPFVITGAIYGGKGKGCLEVNAWPILPLGNVDEKTVKTYSEAVKSGVRGPEFYQNVKINCGSIKHPNWWVMVGPQTTFTVKNDAKDSKRANPDKERLHKEAVARWRREPQKLQDSPKCECGETEAQHDGPGGVCGLADCNCSGFVPATLVDATAEAQPADVPYDYDLQMIPVDRIVPSATNPRKHFNQAKLQELADSIIEHGILEPILVRPTKLDPIPGGEYDEESFAIQYYEIVAGERRWRAAKMAGLKVVESKVRDLDDRAALEIQMIENLQRVDISPIEEADGYMAMLELKDEKGASVYTVDSLAARIGKKGRSKGYVYGRLKLRNLPPPALEALAKGDLPTTIGELIGRLPSMEMRQEFWDDQFEDYGKDWFEMPSFRDIKETIERQFMRELKGSPFSQTDGKLIPGVPSCAKCPKKTGNDRANYPDGRADLCTDVSCFQDKVQAHVKREAEKAKSAGANVLDEAETRAILQGAGDSSWLTSEGRRKYFELDDSPWQIEDQRTYKELLDGHLDPVIAVSPQGKTHLLAPRAEAEKILKDVHGIKPEAQRNHDTYKDSEKKHQEEKKLRQATAVEIVTRALNDVDDELFNHVKFLRLVAKLLVDHGHADVARPIAKRRGAEVSTSDVRGSVEKIVDGLADADVPGFIVEWLLHGEMESWAVWGSNMAGKFPLCGYFGLKPTVVMKEVAAKQKAEKKSKAKPKGKAVATA